MNSIMIMSPTQRGFTLVEMLVYLAILILILTAAIAVMFSLREPLSTYRANQLLYRTADTVLTRFVTEVRSASSVNVPGSTFFSSPGVLTLNTDGGSRRFALVDGDIEYSEAGTYVGDLDGVAVEVTSLRFYHYISVTTEAVRTALTLTATVDNVSKTETFYETVVLRDSYE